MKHVSRIALLVVLFGLVLSSCHKPEPLPREQLMHRLRVLQEQGCMFGHQDDPFYGIGWAYEPNRSDVLETCGDYPAVMGFELGGIEMGDKKNLDSVPFDLMRREIIAHRPRECHSFPCLPRRPPHLVPQGHRPAQVIEQNVIALHFVYCPACDAGIFLCYMIVDFALIIKRRICLVVFCISRSFLCAFSALSVKFSLFSTIFA